MTIQQWNLKQLDGTAAPIPTSFLGKPLLILLYSIGCPGCKSRAIPYAKAWHDQYGDRLQVIGVHTQLGPAKYSIRQIQEINLTQGIPFPVFEDEGHQTFDLLEGEGTPHWVLVDDRGNILRSVFGSMPNAIHRIDYALLEMMKK